MSSDGQLTNINLKAGIYKNTTELGAEGRCTDADNVRWFYEQPQKMGGRVPELAVQHDASASTHFTGVARDIKAWQNNEAAKKYLAVATNKKIEIFYSGEIYDMTPIRVTVTVTNQINTSVSSTQVLISANSHAANAGDFVILQSVASSVGGILFTGQYEIVSVVDANSFLISALTTAVATSAAGGGKATLTFLLNNGGVDNAAAIGWGSGGYGRQGYGTPLSSGSGLVPLDEWSLDLWGEDLMACRRGGKIYWWDEDLGLTATQVDRTSVRMVPVTAAPSVNNLILVSQPSRHLVSFGCTNIAGSFSPLNVRWSNQEDFNNWDPTVSVVGGNTSGEQLIRGGSQIIGAAQTRGEIIILTDDPVYIMRYAGDPFTFSFDQVGDHAGAVSQHSMIDVQGTLYWMGIGDFHKYDGRVQTINCDLQDAMFKTGNKESLNFNQKEKVFCGVNSQFNEIIWFYPADTATECSRYVIHNYLENTWYDGAMDRTVWVDHGIFDKPYAVDTSGALYVQETGVDNGAQALPFFFETSYFDLQDGTDFVFIDRVVPDFKRIPTGKQLNMYITTKRYPQDPNPVVKGPYTIQSDTQKISLRARGRQAKLRFESSANGVDFEMGLLKVGIKPDGKR